MADRQGNSHSMTRPSRRLFLGLGVARIAAPAIVRVGSIMPVKLMEVEDHGLAVGDFVELYGVSQMIQALPDVRAFNARLRELNAEAGQ